MAHLEKYKRKDIIKVMKEAYREHRSQKAYRNNVDLSKSHLNYSMEGITRKACLNRLDARCLEVMEGRKIQSQTAVVGSWVFTAPEEIRGDSEKEREYFRWCYEFNKERYGPENTIDGIVHYDESAPHMTVYVVPVTTSRKTGRRTISSASLFTLKELSTYHDDLETYLFERMHIRGLAKNGRTKGNYSIAELKERSKQDAITEKLKEQQKQIQIHIEQLQEETKALEKQKNELRKEIEKMSNEINIEKIIQPLVYLEGYDRFLDTDNKYGIKSKKIIDGKYFAINGKKLYDHLCKRAKKELDVFEFMKGFKCYDGVTRRLPNETYKKPVLVCCYDEYVEACSGVNNDGARGDKELRRERKLPDLSSISDNLQSDREMEF